MRRVTGIGGIFMSAKDPKALCDWYKKHLGIDVQDWGGAAFTWTDSDGNPTKGTTIWSVGPAEGTHFAPSKSTFMVNYRVEDLAALLKALREEGCNVLRRPTTRSTGNSDGSWIQRTTKWNSGNRHKGNEVRLLARRTDVYPSGTEKHDALSNHRNSRDHVSQYLARSRRSAREG